MKTICTKQTIFARIASCIASVNMAHVVLSLLFVGMMVTIAGILVECSYQTDLLKQGGNAFEAYQNQMQAQAIDSATQYVNTGLQLALPSAGGNLQAIGLAICYLLTPCVFALLFALRMAGFEYAPEDWELTAA